MLETAAVKNPSLADRISEAAHAQAIIWYPRYREDREGRTYAVAGILTARLTEAARILSACHLEQRAPHDYEMDELRRWFTVTP